MTKWRLKRVVQCDKCPWRVSVDPRTIPRGYSETQHAALACTIAKPGDIGAIFDSTEHVMACHETNEAHCLGWLMHQLGPGNNIALRIRMLSCANLRQVRLRGLQHQTFDATLP